MHWLFMSGKSDAASKAPMSHLASLRGTPRWSVAGQMALSPVSLAILIEEIDSVNVGPPLLARTPRSMNVRLFVVMPGPNPIVAQDPSLSNEESPIAVIPLPEQSCTLEKGAVELFRTISELLILICSPQDENSMPSPLLSDTVTLVSVSEAQPTLIPAALLFAMVEFVKKLLPPLSPPLKPNLFPEMVMPLAEKTPGCQRRLLCRPHSET